jgi:hypothetical protein
MNLGVLLKLDKFGTLKNYYGPPEGHGQPVEKHCSKEPDKTKLKARVGISVTAETCLTQKQN